jgi:catechol 2,3-dioxygenase-like lactoylglutathione lyase family enzyme
MRAEAPMTTWYSRPLVFVRDSRASLDYYCGMLGFSVAWRHEEEGRLLTAQVDRDGTQLILTEQWPEKAGNGVVFVSLDDDAAVDALRVELAGRGVEVREGWWGYRLLVARDPDGNELWVPYSSG